MRFAGGNVIDPSPDRDTGSMLIPFTHLPRLQQYASTLLTARMYAVVTPQMIRIWEPEKNDKLIDLFHIILEIWAQVGVFKTTKLYM